MNDESSNNSAVPWEIFRFFLGRWDGTGSGKPSESQVEREYKFVLNDQFIQINDRSVYEPQERNQAGEVHEEIGYISYDRSRDKFVLREFHVEGYVNQYVLEDWEVEGKVLVFKTESIENIRAGWQARTTYEIRGNDEFRETFDLAGPDQEWSCFITNEFKRAD